MQIAEFFASLKLKPDHASIARADRWLKVVEKRVQRSAKRMEKNNILATAFKVDSKKLNRQLQQTLDRLSKNLVLDITRFRINENGLSRALGSTRTTLPINKFRIDSAALRRSLETAMAGVHPSVRPSVRPGQQPRNVTSPRSSIPSGSSGGRGRVSIRPGGIGFAAGGVGVFGGFGVAALNRTVRELESLPVAMEAVSGSPERAQAELAFLNTLGNEVGAPVRSLAPSYTKFLASAIGTDLEPHAQTGFRSLTRYGAVMGLDDEAMKGTFRAVEQMVNKQQIMAEELKGQLSERLPAAIRLMADAATGGDTAKLFEMMKKGELDPNKYLPLFFEQLEAKAAGGWDKYIQTIGYQQNQTAKRFEDFIKLFSSSGGNEGFFRIWKGFADTLPRLENIAKALGSAFNMFGDGVQRAGDIMVMLNDAIGWFQEQSPNVQTMLGSLGAAFLLLGTRIGRAFLPLTAAFLILEDMAAYHQGKKSITGLAMGVDYDNPPNAISNNPNPYAGNYLGGVIAETQKNYKANPNIGNFMLDATAKTASRWYESLDYTFTNPSSILDTFTAAMPWNWGDPTNLSNDSMNATINSVSGMGGIMQGINGDGNNEYTFYITPDANGKVVEPDQFVKEISKAMSNLVTREGGG